MVNKRFYKVAACKQANYCFYLRFFRALFVFVENILCVVSWYLRSVNLSVVFQQLIKVVQKFIRTIIYMFKTRVLICKLGLL